MHRNNLPALLLQCKLSVLRASLADSTTPRSPLSPTEKRQQHPASRFISAAAYSETLAPTTKTQPVSGSVQVGAATKISQASTTAIAFSSSLQQSRDSLTYDSRPHTYARARRSECRVMTKRFTHACPLGSTSFSLARNRSIVLMSSRRSRFGLFKFRHTAGSGHSCRCC